MINQGITIVSPQGETIDRVCDFPVSGQYDPKIATFQVWAAQPGVVFLAAEAMATFAD
jgi:hypothetical protein